MSIYNVLLGYGGIVTVPAGNYQNYSVGNGTFKIPVYENSITIKIWGGGGGGGSSSTGGHSAGGNGGNSTITINGITSTAKGGGGGPASAEPGVFGGVEVNGVGAVGVTPSGKNGPAGTGGSGSTGGNGGSAHTGGAGGEGIASTAENTVFNVRSEAKQPGGGGGGGAILWETSRPWPQSNRTNRIASGGGGAGGVIIIQGGIGLRDTTVSYNIGDGGTRAYSSTGQRGGGGVGAPGGITISWT